MINLVRGERERMREEGAVGRCSRCGEFFWSQEEIAYHETKDTIFRHMVQPI